MKPHFCHFVFQSTKSNVMYDIHILGCRWNERLKSKTDGSMCLGYTGLCGELEHLKIETRLIGESFECVMGEFEIQRKKMFSLLIDKAKAK